MSATAIAIPDLSPDVPPYGSPEWVLWRRGGLGASDLPVLVGADPWRSEYALALDKRGETEARPQTTAQGWGHRMEAVGAEEYAERTGRTLLPGGTATDARWPHLYASPDRRIEGDPTRLLEVKYTTRWDEPPRHVVIQCYAQMGLTGADVVDVLRMGPYGEPTITEIPRDDEAITDLLDLGEAWYVRFVLGDELPPVDGSEEAHHYLDRHAGNGEMQATAEQSALMGALRLARRQKEAAEAQESLYRNLVRESMAGADVLTGDGFRVLWRPTKGRTTTNWRAAYEALAAVVRVDAGPAAGALQAWDDCVGEIVRDHTTTSEGGMTFRPTWDEEE